jgi:hypothetical protein
MRILTQNARRLRAVKRVLDRKIRAGLAKVRLGIIRWRMTQTPEWRLHRTVEWRFERYAMRLGNWAKLAFPGRVMLRREASFSRITLQIGSVSETVTINVMGPIGNVTFIVSPLNNFRLRHTLTPVDSFPNGYRVLSDCGSLDFGCTLFALGDGTEGLFFIRKDCEEGMMRSMIRTLLELGKVTPGFEDEHLTPFSLSP